MRRSYSKKNSNIHLIRQLTFRNVNPKKQRKTEALLDFIKHNSISFVSRVDCARGPKTRLVICPRVFFDSRTPLHYIVFKPEYVSGAGGEAAGPDD